MTCLLVYPPPAYLSAFPFPYFPSMSPYSFTGKRVVILGLARQGLALARFLVAEGAQVTLSDAAPADQLTAPLAELAGLPVRVVPGGHPLELLEDCDLLCLSGGVPPQIPFAGAARRQGIPLSNDALLTMALSPTPVWGITGSSGKTTTTTLVGLMLQAHAVTQHPAPTVWVGGNIGVPLIDKLAAIGPTDQMVLELSSFQLELFNTENGGEARSPHGAAILNITPNHLDRHPSMAHYAAAKANIVRWQQPADVAVLGADDALTGAWLRSGRVQITAEAGQPAVDFPLAARRLGFGLQQPHGEGCWLSADGSALVLRLDGREQTLLPISTVLLRGRHNLLNIAAACIISAAAGATPAVMAEVTRTFRGVAHRLELVRQQAGVRWINDSIATAPERAAAALRSFSEPIIWLAGGRDKHLPWDEISRLAQQRVRRAVLFGEAAGLIAAALHVAAPDLPVILCRDLDQAVAAAAQAAQPGDVVLLSPGGTSYDAYKDFAARGDHFRALVEALSS